MSAKPRSDSKLKLLPEERQDQIVGWAMEPKTDTCPGGLKHALDQLAADGIKVSIRALSEFLSWYRLRQRFAAADSRARQVEEMLLEKDPSMSPEKVRELGQALFTLEAIDAGDAETFVSLESLKLAQDSAATKGKIEIEKLQLQRIRIEVMVCEKALDWFEDKQAREIMEGSGSRAEKIAALRKSFFKDVDALQASGKVVLPE
jgi:hypothetical protein